MIEADFVARTWAKVSSEDRKQRASLDERLDVLVRQTHDQQRYLRYLLVAAGALALLLVVVLGSRVASRRASAAGG